LVLVSGCHPIRTNKARYYENRELKARILPPPMLSRRSATMTTDWSSPSGAANWPAPIVGPSKSSTGDPTNSGIPREPDLPKNEEIAPEQRLPAQEFEAPEDESDDDAHRLRAFLRKVGIIRRK
jgi:type IV secretion system protein VirD4